jgi:hypothetical protein
MPADLVQRVLASAPSDVVLIGGQALAYWMGFYAIHAHRNTTQAISRDVDFLTTDAANVDPLAHFARAIRGRAEVHDSRGLSALIGSAIAPAGEGRIYNVDLLRDVIGLKRDHVAANAVRVTVPGTGSMLRVMHPIDVLQSRNVNLHTLPEKQDEAGQLQLQLAIEVARKYLEQEIEAIKQHSGLTDGTRQRAIFDVIGAVTEYSTEDAARKNAERHGIFLADAIPAWCMESDLFWEKQWPHLRARMSPDYAGRCEDQAGRNG